MEKQNTYNTGSTSNPMSRRKFLKVMSVGIGAGLLGACGSQTSTPSITPTADENAPSTESGILTVWGWAGSFEGVKNQIDALGKKYPSVIVDVKEFSYEAVHSKLLASISAGNAPDLCAVDAGFLRQYVSGLTDLTEQAKKYVDQFISPTIDLASVNGKLYGLPAGSDPMGVYYRKDLWDQYGIKEEEIKTWADLVTAGEKVFEASQGKVYLYSQFANSPMLLEVLVLSQGFPGYYFNEDDTKVIVDDPKFIEAVTVLKKLWDGKGSLHNPDKLPDMLKSGKLASQIIGPSSYASTIMKMTELSGKWRVMRAPAVKQEGARVGYQYPAIFVIPEKSDLKGAAWELCHLGVTGDGAKSFFNTWHSMPAFKPLVDEYKSKPDEFFGGQKVMELWENIGKDAPKIHFGAGFKEAQQIMGTYLDAILNGKKKVEDGLKEAAAEMRTKLKKS